MRSCPEPTRSIPSPAEVRARPRRARSCSRGARRLALLPALALLVAAPVAARAQAEVIESQSFPVERLRLASDREGILDVEWGAVGRHLGWNLGLWLGGADDPLVLTRVADGSRIGALVDDRVSGGLAGAIGLWGRAALGVELPFVLHQGRPSGVEGVETALPGLAAAGLGDLRLAPKVALLAARRHGVDLALVPALTIPLGGAHDYLREGGLTFAPEIAASRRLGGGLRLAANLGYRLRERATLLDVVVDDELTLRAGAAVRLRERGGPPVELALTVAGATAAGAPFAAANRNALEALVGGLLDLPGGASVFVGGGAGLHEGFGTPDWRLVAGARFTPDRFDGDRDGVEDPGDRCPEEPEDRDLFQDGDGCADLDDDGDGIADAADGAPREPEDRDGHQDDDGVPDPDNDGDGLADAVDRCALEPETANGYQDGDGCPDEIPDTDGDGHRDDVDRCPGEAEDRDGHEDADGCPEPDNDGDGVGDATDGCPLEPGPADNRGCPDPDRDGDSVVDRFDNCPDEAGDPIQGGCLRPQLVAIESGRLAILEAVTFKRSKDALERRSYALLDNVAAVILAHPELGVIRVEGHTDSDGDDAPNLDLSRRRAESVVRYLERKGVPAARLQAEGYGEARPIADNATRDGRAANRRVEFVIGDAPAGGGAPPR